MEVTPISCEQVRRKLERGEHVVLVDALSPMAFAHSHLPGAVNLPPERVEEATVARRVPDRGTEIVVYCANDRCESSLETANALAALGYSNVRHFRGGKDEWRARGLPLERGRRPLPLS